MKYTVDTVVDSRVRVCQPERGFRFSTDAVFLSWFAKVTNKQRIIDIGSGSGIIASLLSIKKNVKHIDAIELQPEMYRYLTATVKECGLEGSVCTINSDIKEYRPVNQYDGAVCNPPYRCPESGHLPDNETELNAKFTTTMKADDIFSFCRSFLKFGAGLFMSYDADMMPVLFESAFKYGFEAKRLLPVCPDINIKPKIILIEFRKGGKRELNFEAPIYQKINGIESEITKKILAGEWN